MWKTLKKVTNYDWLLNDLNNFCDQPSSCSISNSFTSGLADELIRRMIEKGNRVGWPEDGNVNKSRGFCQCCRPCQWPFHPWWATNCLQYRKSSFRSSPKMLYGHFMLQVRMCEHFSVAKAGFVLYVICQSISTHFHTTASGRTLQFSCSMPSLFFLAILFGSGARLLSGRVYVG